MQCGRDYVSWHHFSEFRVKWDESIGIAHCRRHHPDLRKCSAFDLDRCRLREEGNLKDLLQSFQTSLCSDVRDKVYGLASLASDGQELPLDYSKSVFEVFADVLSVQRGAQTASLIAFARSLQRILDIHPWDNIPDSKSLSVEFVRTIGRGRGIISLLGQLLSYFDPPRLGLDVEESVTAWPAWSVGNFLSLKQLAVSREKLLRFIAPYLMAFMISRASLPSRSRPFMMPALPPQAHRRPEPTPAMPPNTTIISKTANETDN